MIKVDPRILTKSFTFVLDHLEGEAVDDITPANCILTSDLWSQNNGRLILKGEKVQNMLTSRLISENLIRTEICFDVYCYGKPAV